MPIATPSNTRISTETHSDFVLCQDFVFRPSTVDGFAHHVSSDSDDPVTTVNFKSYTQTIRDPEGRLFHYLVNTIKPKSVDEAL